MNFIQVPRLCIQRKPRWIASPHPDASIGIIKRPQRRGAALRPFDKVSVEGPIRAANAHRTWVVPQTNYIEANALLNAIAPANDLGRTRTA